MPFDFTCPFCHTRTRVDDKFAGQSGPCVNCSKTIQLPGQQSRCESSNGQSWPVQEGNSRLQSAKKSFVPALIALFILLGLLTVGIIAGVASMPHVKQAIVASGQRKDLINMKKIVSALNNYADRYGTYPPTVVRDDSGKPLYSWRVLILPFLGYDSIYQNFQLDQPHDSPANLLVAGNMPQVFQSVDHANALSQGYSHNNYCNYVLISGPGTLFPPSGPMGNKDIDIPTLLLVETNNQGLSWTEPGDIRVSDGARPGNRPLKDLGGITAGSFVAVCTDGSPLIIPDTISGAFVDAIISPKGGETVDIAPYESFK